MRNDITVVILIHPTNISAKFYTTWQGLSALNDSQLYQNLEQYL